MTSVAQGRDPFALDDSQLLKKTAVQFDNQRYVVQRSTASKSRQHDLKRRSVAAEASKEFTSTPISHPSPSASQSTASSATASGQYTSSSPPRQHRPSVSRTATTPGSLSAGAIPPAPAMASDEKGKDKAKPRAKDHDKSNNKMHQTSSKILRMTDDDRPFTKDFKDLFATLITSLPLSAHRVRFTKIEETFLSEEAITHLGSLKFSQSNRIPDPKNPSRWIVTTTTTTFSMAKEMARSVCQRFVDARLIESAEQKDYASFPAKGAVWMMTTKGTATLKRFCDRNGIEAKHIEPIIRRPQMQMVELERNAESDKLIHDKFTMEVIFRRFAGQEGPNLKTSVQAADSDSISEYSSGLIGVKMASERKIGEKFYQFTFTGKAASDWLFDCCTTIDRRETYEICELFLKFRLITCLVEDRAYNRTVDHPTNFQPTRNSIYGISEHGRRVCGWLSRQRPHSVSSEDASDGREKLRMPRDTNVNRLRAILDDTALRMLFKEHLKTSLCEENLNFYLDAHDFIAHYREVEKDGRLKEPGSVRENLATAYGFYNSFLASGAPSELNIDHALRNKLDSCMTQTESDKQNTLESLKSVVTLINDASNSVFKLMATDSVPKFIREPRYQQVLRDHDFDLNGSSRSYTSAASGSDISLNGRHPSC